MIKQYAQNHTSPALDASSIPFAIDHKLDFNKLNAEHMIGLLQLIKILAPSGNHLFDWKGNQALLQDKAFSFIVVTTYAELPNELKEENINNDTGAFTTVTIIDGIVTLQTYILLDKLFFDQSGNQYPDGHIRLLDAMGHELYGNIQTYLKIPTTDLLQGKRPDRIPSQISTFEAGIGFLKRLENYAQENSWPQSLQEDIDNLLEKKQKELEFWKKQEQNQSKLQQSYQPIDYFNIGTISNPIEI